MASPPLAPAALLLTVALGAPACGGGSDGPTAQAPATAAPQAMPEFRPGPVEPDLYHPDRRALPDGSLPPLPEPALGGEVSVHLSGMPARLNLALGADSNAAIVLASVHEGLTSTDYESWQTRLDLARERWLEDQLVLADDAPPRAGEQVFAGLRVLAGRLEDQGESWRIAPLAPGNPLAAELSIPKSEVREVIPDGAVTFELREGVLWHPSPGFERHVFDVDDVLFSFSIYANPHVQCGERRYQYQKIAQAVRVDERRVRFHLARYDAWAVDDARPSASRTTTTARARATSSACTGA
jgi:ABC-type transport system substrate-binding protein